MVDRRELLKRAAIILGSCVTGSAWAGTLRWIEEPRKTKNSVLSKTQYQMVSAFAELIIPTTDTPGAIAAGVPDFIDMMVSDWYAATERGIFLAGLKNASAFSSYSPQQQKAELDAAMAAGSSYQPPMASLLGGETDEASPFFHKLRELTVLGYYTSEVGATQELRLNLMPGRYEGDYPLDKVGRAWSTGGPL